MSQRDTVAALLRQDGGITDDVAMRHGVRELRKVVYTLRKEGWEIDTYPTHASYPFSPVLGHYVLVAEPGQPKRQLDAGL